MSGNRIPAGNSTPQVANLQGLGALVAQFLATPSGANLLTMLTSKSGSGLPLFDTSPTIGTPTINNSTDNYPRLKSPKEIITISATAATGTINFDVLTQAILYYTTSATANFTLNVRGSSGATLDSLMTANQDALTIVFMNTNGATPYLLSALTIDGGAQTIKWSGGVAPSAGDASAIDAYSMTIIKTGTGAFTVLGGMVKFA